VVNGQANFGLQITKGEPNTESGLIRNKEIICIHTYVTQYIQISATVLLVIWTFQLVILLFNFSQKIFIFRMVHIFYKLLQ
jgi:hypothetical protein